MGFIARTDNPVIEREEPPTISRMFFPSKQSLSWVDKILESDHLCWLPNAPTNEGGTPENRVIKDGDHAPLIVMRSMQGARQGTCNTVATPAHHSLP